MFVSACICASAPLVPTRRCYIGGAPWSGMLMDLWRGVVSPTRMCNEPCSASVTFGLIDYKQRPFNMQGCNKASQMGLHIYGMRKDRRVLLGIELSFCPHEMR